MAAQSDAQPPLFDAAQANDVDSVRAIIANEGRASRRSGPFGWTALHVAAGYGAKDVVEVLVAAGISVDVRSSDGETPMHIAAQQGSNEGVEALAANGADINPANDDGETPLHTAVQHIGGKDAACIASLLDLRADPLVRDNEGHDAFAHARISTNRGDEIEPILRRNGASPDASGVDPRNFAREDEESVKPGELGGALAAACKQGKVNCVEQLLEMGADRVVTAQQTLVSAAKGGHVEVIEYLVAAKADVCSASDTASDTTPLIAAADENMVKMVKWLLAKGVNASTTQRDGANALMAASLRGCDETTAALLAARADVNHGAHEGWTALMVACQGGHATVAKRLLDAGARLDATDNAGASGKDLASANGHVDVVKLLETRSKLNSRRAKASAASSKPTGDAKAADDTRDIDALLSELGEPSKSTTKKKKGGTKIAAAARAEISTAVAAAVARAAQPGATNHDRDMAIMEQVLGVESTDAKAAAGDAVSGDVDVSASVSDNTASKAAGKVVAKNASAVVPPVVHAGKGRDNAADAQSKDAKPGLKDVSVIKAPCKTAGNAAPTNASKSNKSNCKAADADRSKTISGSKDVLANEAPTDSIGKCAALKKRLQEIERLRAELDAEELALRREVMSLERS